MSGLVLVMLGVCGLMFVVTRFHMLHLAYTHKQHEHENNQWLLEQCAYHEFYHNMKHHSNICEEVTTSSHESLWLSAVDHVVRNSHLCGQHACLSLVETAVVWMLSRGLLLSIVAVVGMLIAPTVMLPYWRHRVCYATDFREEALLTRPSLKFAVDRAFDA